MNSAKRLLTPLLYLRIDRQGKIFDEIFLPVLLLCFTYIVFWALDWKLVIFGGSGLVAGVGSYLQVVTGFYIASLAAVATFNQKNMDVRMAGDSPSLTVEWKGRRLEEKLTRRRFLCFLFGYLSFLSVFVYFGGVGANLLAQPIVNKLPVDWLFWVKWGFVSCYLLVVYNLICTTLLGLYYMTERIHRPESEFVEQDAPGEEIASSAPDEPIIREDFSSKDGGW